MFPSIDLFGKWGNVMGYDMGYILQPEMGIYTRRVAKVRTACWAVAEGAGGNPWEGWMEDVDCGDFFEVHLCL
jgi:hypothetical protein